MKQPALCNMHDLCLFRILWVTLLVWSWKQWKIPNILQDGGKQPPVREVSKVPPPPSKVDHELEALLDLQPAAAAAEEIDGYEPSVLDDSEKVPPDLDEEMPALRVVRAGGESLPTGTQFTDRGEIEKVQIGTQLTGWGEIKKVYIISQSMCRKLGFST